MESLKSAYVLKNPMAIYEVKEQKLTSMMDKLSDIIKNKIEVSRVRLLNTKESYVLKNPLGFYEKDREKINTLESKLTTYINTKIELNRAKLLSIKESYILKNPEEIIKSKNKEYDLLLNKLELLNPLAILKKGYSVITKDGISVKTSKDLKNKDIIDVRLGEGAIIAEVKEILE